MSKKSLLLINSISSLAAKFGRIIEVFPDPEEMLSVTKGRLESLSFLTDREVGLFFKMKRDGFADKEISAAQKEGLALIDIDDPLYPRLLKEISSPPLVLYTRGCVEALNGLSMAIVGTRLPTIYGRDMAARFSSGLAGLNCVIVSGLARGIDTAAHKAALDAGRTVAVLGSGLQNIYPRENRGLAEEISAAGAVVSEFPLSCPPLKENFPRRNRIISGLSRGVLVIEAPVKSGSLITAGYALEQGREVFALPGQANSPLSRGTHLLIKQGARLVDSLEDIIDELQIHFTRQTVFLPGNRQEQDLFDLLGKGGMCLEEILIRSRMGRDDISKALLSLQIKGLIKELRPLYYSKVDI